MSHSTCNDRIPLHLFRTFYSYQQRFSVFPENSFHFFLGLHLGPLEYLLLLRMLCFSIAFPNLLLLLEKKFDFVCVLIFSILTNSLTGFHSCGLIFCVFFLTDDNNTQIMIYIQFFPIFISIVTVSCVISLARLFTIMLHNGNFLKGPHVSYFNWSSLNK